MVAIASLGLVLVGGEVGLRVVGYSRRLAEASNPWARWVVYDPLLVRRNQPGYVDAAGGIRINSLGLRGEEITVPKPAGVVRIVCLGDSTTFGVFKNGPLDVRATASYPAALATLLDAQGYRNVETVNAGMLGATSASGLALFVTVLRRVGPDVLVVRLGNNDHTRIVDASPVLSTDLEYAVLRRLPDWAIGSELVRLSFHAYHRVLARTSATLEGVQVPLDRYEQNLRRLVDEARAIGTHVLFLDYPYREIARGLSPGETLPNALDDVQTIEELYALQASYQARTAAVARDTGSGYLRTEDVLLASPVRAFTDYDLIHPNDDGARVLAAIVLEKLRELGWLEVTGGATPSPATAAARAGAPGDGSTPRGE